jgi:predicted acyltransferase
VNNRYYSLDVFRGATVCLMILVNNPGSWGHIYAPLEHAGWHGCTPTDLVFPFFLFAVGNAMAFVIPKLQQKGQAQFWKKVLTRFALIFLIGLFLNWSPFVKYSGDSLVFKPWTWLNDKGELQGIRILGVLQRIALCYLFASIIVYYCKPRLAFVISAVLLMLYWWCTYAFGTGDPYSIAGFVGTKIDLNILSQQHMYHGEGVAFDPEGLFSTIPAIVQVVFGYFTGSYIIAKGKNFEMLANLFVAGAILLFAGYMWDMSFPINKKIWTSSYVLFTTGLALIILGVFIYLLEFKKLAVNGTGKLVEFENTYSPWWSKFFNVFGKNPLFVFVLSGFLPRLSALLRWKTGINEKGDNIYTSFFPWVYDTICKPISENLKNGSLLYALIIIAFYWFIAYMLDKKKIYIKV